MTEVLLHAGFHKTGTSALQVAASHNRRLLNAGGVLYPRLWPATFRPASAHHFLAHAVAGDERFVALEQAHSLISGWRRWAERTGGRILLSSEAICRQQLGDAPERLDRQRTYLERLAELLEGFEVQPVLVVRRQDDFVRSLYQEHVAAGLGASARLSFSDFLAQFASGKAGFLDRIRLFRDVFGPVRVLVYEDLADRNLPVAFFEQLGIQGLTERGSPPVRQSLGVGQTLVKQELNKWVHTEYQNRLLLWWLVRTRIRGVIEAELGGRVSLWPDQITRTQFLEQFDEENVRIAREFLGRNGCLFPPLGDSRPEDEHCNSPEQIAAVVKRAVGAGRWSLRAILGRKAVEWLLKS